MEFHLYTNLLHSSMYSGPGWPNRWSSILQFTTTVNHNTNTVIIVIIANEVKTIEEERETVLWSRSFQDIKLLWIDCKWTFGGTSFFFVTNRSRSLNLPLNLLPQSCHADKGSCSIEINNHPTTSTFHTDLILQSIYHQWRASQPARDNVHPWSSTHKITIIIMSTVIHPPTSP